MTSIDLLKNNKRSIFNSGLQKNINYIEPVIYPGNGLYSKKYTFEIPKNIGINPKYSQFFIETKLTSSQTQTNYQDRIGSRIYKELTLETIKNTKLIQRIVPDYTNMKVDFINNQALLNSVLNSMETDITFSANTEVKVFTPCFFSGSYTGFDEQLQITVITNDSYLDMGLEFDTLTSLTNKLIVISYNDSIYDIPIKRTFRALNSFHELPLAISTNATSVSMNLTTGFNIKYLCMVIRNTYQEYHGIDQFSLYTSDKCIVPMFDRRINYDIISRENNDAGTLIYNASSLYTRYLDPLILTVNFPIIGSGYSLYVFYEHETLVNVDKFGSINMFIEK